MNSAKQILLNLIADRPEDKISEVIYFSSKKIIIILVAAALASKYISS